MIIVLKDADFTYENIGQIELPIEIRPEIESILSNYTKSMTNSQRGAFQIFYDSISSILPKIKVLYIPLLAENLGETTFNIADSMSNVRLNESVFKFKDGGIYSEVGTDVSSFTPATIATLSSVDGNNIHIIAAHSSYTETTKRVAFSFGNKTTTRIRFKESADNQYVKPIIESSSEGVINSKKIVSYQNYVEYDTCAMPIVNKAFGVSILSGRLSSMIVLHKDTGATNIDHDITITDELGTLGNCGIGDYDFSSNPVCFISIGDGLTLDEMKLYESAINKLISVFVE